MKEMFSCSWLTLFSQNKILLFCSNCNNFCLHCMLKIKCFTFPKVKFFGSIKQVSDWQDQVNKKMQGLCS